MSHDGRRQEDLPQPRFAAFHTSPTRISRLTLRKRAPPGVLDIERVFSIM
jgi:hypothetical protein